MKKLIFILFLIFLAKYNYSQENKYFADDFLDADAFMFEDNYADALKILLDLYHEDSTNANISFRIGLCYMNSSLEKEKSIRYFVNAIKNTADDADMDSYLERHAPFDAYFYLGQAYRLNYQFDAAIAIFKLYMRELKKPEPELVERIDREIEICAYAKELIKYPVELEIKNLGPVVNSPFDDHSPVLSVDESVLIFTSKREGSTGGMQTDDGQYYEDIYASKKNNNEWSAPQGISTNINTDSHESCMGLSADGQKLLIYKDDNGDGNIYVSDWNGKEWGIPKSLGPLVNSGYNEKHAAFSADNKYLFFTSDRKGGYGGYDIYLVKQLPNGEWSEPQNLGQNINTPYDEYLPFMHSDGTTLYFASQGHKTMGGFDIFASKINIEEGTCSEPINLGYPVNTTDDDFFFRMSIDGKRAWFSSTRAGSIGNSDIYMITFKEGLEKPLALMTGVLQKDFIKGSGEVSITVSDAETKKTIGIFTPNKTNGKFVFILPADKKYIATFQADGYVMHSEEITVPKESVYDKSANNIIELRPVLLQCLSQFVNLSFRNGSTDLTDSTKNKLKKAVNFIKKNSGTIITFANQRSGKMKNKITDKQIENVMAYMDDYGIDKNRFLLSGAPAENADVYEFKISDSGSSSQLAAGKDKSKGEIKDLKYNESDSKKETDKSITVVNDILFGFNVSKISKEDHPNLDKLANYLLKNSRSKIQIAGYTDSKGSDEYNEKLSYKRAKSVKNYLVKKGIKKKNMIIKKFGKANSIVKNENDDGSPNETGMALNRRVEFSMIREGKKGKIEFKKADKSMIKNKPAAKDKTTTKKKTKTKKN
ncbi:MAG: PD40 domain-containing protein [Bacteroidia bacterium]|nr:PD40 domain-containing protein [Bacteroidia bacterium]